MSTAYDAWIERAGLLSPKEEDDDEKGGGDESKEKGVADRLFKARVVICSKGVDDKLAAGMIAQLFALERDDKDKPVTVIVNSPGGSADSGFAIYDAMRFISCPVRSITMGICASAGVMIFLGGAEGQRFCTPSARFLLHQPSMRTSGQASDLEIVSREIDRLKLQYNLIVAEASGRPVKDVERDVNRDFWLSAPAALEYGLVNKVVTSRKEIE